MVGWLGRLVGCWVAGCWLGVLVGWSSGLNGLFFGWQVVCSISQYGSSACVRNI